MRLFAALLLLGLALPAIGCKPAPAVRPAHPPAVTRATAVPESADLPQPRSLFDRLGGTAGVTKLVNDFIASAMEDPNVNFTRKGTPAEWKATPQNLALLKKRMIEFLSTTTGGDTPYTGQDMVTAHRGMDITDAQFDAIAADLKQALEKNKVAAAEQFELLALVNRTRSAIVAAPKSESSAPPKQNPAAAPPITSDETELESAPATDRKD